MELSGRILLVGQGGSPYLNITELQKFGCEFSHKENLEQAQTALLEDSTFDLLFVSLPADRGAILLDLIRHGDLGSIYKDIPVLAFSENIRRADQTILQPLQIEDIKTLLEKKRMWIDDHAIDRLRELSLKAQKDVVTQLIQIFEEDTPKILTKMHDFLEKQDYFELARQAHTLRSSCANLGVTRMKDVCGWIERLSLEKKEFELVSLLLRLEKEFKKVLPHLRLL